MYVTDAAQSSTDVEALRSAMRDSKAREFQNLFLCPERETGRHQRLCR